MIIKPLRASALVALLIAGLADPAKAELISTLSGNDCSGLFGKSFATCAIPTEFDPTNTPVIIKFNADGSVSQINSDLFPTIGGSEFSFTFNADGSGTWLYTPDAGDPMSLVTFFVAKGGPNFNLFSNPVGSNTNSWGTPLNPNNGKPYGLSHLTFYEGGASAPVPEPATMFLVGAGLIAAAQRFRRRNGAPQ